MTPNASPETLGVGWQLIETAPDCEDGILVVDASKPTPAVGVARFLDGKWRGFDLSYGTECLWTAPTHWMRLPSAPVTGNLSASPVGMSAANEPKADKSQTDMGERVAELEAAVDWIARRLHADRFPDAPWEGGGTKRSYWRRSARALLNPKLEG